MMRSTAILRRSAINWQSCVSRFFPENARPYKEIEAKLDSLWREVYSAPEKVAPVDWSKWESLIQDKAAVAALKKEYEAKKFVAGTPDVYQTEAQAQASAVAAQKEAEFYKQLVADLKAEIAATDAEMNAVLFMDPVEKIAHVEGLAEEYERQLEDLEPYTPDETIKELETLSATEISESLASGKLPNFPTVAYEALPAESPLRQAVEKKHNEFVAEAAKAGLKLKSIPTLASEAAASN